MIYNRGAQLTLRKYVFLTNKLPFLQTINQFISAGNLHEHYGDVILLPQLLSLCDSEKKGNRPSREQAVGY